MSEGGNAYMVPLLVASVLGKFQIYYHSVLLLRSVY